jgi:hypothetical protein
MRKLFINEIQQIFLIFIHSKQIYWQYPEID